MEELGASVQQRLNHKKLYSQYFLLIIIMIQAKVVLGQWLGIEVSRFVRLATSYIVGNIQ